MSHYKGEPVTVPVEINSLYDKVSNVEGYKEMLDKVPENLKKQLNGLEIDDGKIIINSPGIGRIELVQEAATRPSHVAFRALNAPVPVVLSLDLEKVTDNTTRIFPAIEADVPAMLKPFVSSRLQDASTMLGQAFARMFGGQ